MNIELLKDEVKKIPLETLEAKGVITRARSSANGYPTYICPICGNGTGETGDGLAVEVKETGYTYKCFACNANFDNISLLAAYYGLDNNQAFKEILSRASVDFGIAEGTDFQSYHSLEVKKNPAAPSETFNQEVAKKLAQEQELKQKAEELIKADIEKAQSNLKAFVDSQGGKWRGLTLETLEKHHCGYLDNWVPIQVRLNGTKNPTPTPRVIIPAGNHYLARLTVPLETYKDDKNYQYIKEKQHTGSKHPFGIEFITNEAMRLHIVEGEIDAMSLNQIYGTRLNPSVATGSAAVGSQVMTEIFDYLDAVFADSYKPLIYVIFDGDKAGKDNAPKLVAEFIRRGYLAAAGFYSDSDKKVDANSILQEGGDEALRKATGDILRRNVKQLDKLAEEEAIEEPKEKPKKHVVDHNELLQKKGEAAVYAHLKGILDKINNSKKQAKEASPKAEPQKAPVPAQKQNVDFSPSLPLKADKELNSLAQDSNPFQTPLKADKELIKKLFYCKFTDTGNGERLFWCYGNIIRYCFDSAEWYIFANNIWQCLGNKDDALFPLACKVAEIIEDNRPKAHYIKGDDGSMAIDLSKPQSPMEEIKIGEGLSSMWQKTKTKNNAIKELRGITKVLVRKANFDNNPMLLNLKNGYLDLKDGKFYPPDPNKLFTKQCNALYNPSATAPVFEKFIREIIPDEATRAAVLRFLGYCLTGKISEEKFLFVYGEGGNGKGTLFKTIQYLLGSYSTSFNIEAVLKQRVPKDGNAASPEFAKLCGVRLALAPEIPPGKELDATIIKNLTGGDIITARPLYGHPFDFEPTHKFIFSGNNEPKAENVRETGFLRRFRLVEFRKTFDETKADIHLKDKLKTTDELSGILNILLQECLEWQKLSSKGESGLIDSEDMQTTRAEYLAENDFVANFVDEFCVIDKDKSILRKDLLNRLKVEYPKAKIFSDKKLTEMLLKTNGIFYNPRTGKNHMATFFGIDLRDEFKN
jgi:P4 family phage/plasmid primase-like protien